MPSIGLLRLAMTILGIIMGLLGPLAYYEIARRANIGSIWRDLRLLLLYSAAGLSFLALGAGWLDLSTLITSVVVLLVIFIALGIVLEKRSQVMLVGLGDEVVEARLLRRRGSATAFSFMGTGNIYVSEDFMYVLEPGELLAVIAHEKGHTVALQPLSPRLVNSVLAVISVAIAMGSINLLLSPMIPEKILGILVLLAAWGLWVTYNWAWESLADIYSLTKTGVAAYTALQRITGAAPQPLSLRDLYYDFICSMRPRRVKGGLFLVNPHPRPETRLYIMQRLFQQLRERYYL